MNEFRRALLDDSNPPPELDAELAAFFKRQAGAALLLATHSELYRELLERYRREGPSEEIEEIALDAAGNLATTLQSLRSREDLLQRLEITPGSIPPPVVVLDQVLYSFLLLTGPYSEDELEAALDPEMLDDLMHAPQVEKWLAALGADKPLEDLLRGE